MVIQNELSPQLLPKSWHIIPKGAQLVKNAILNFDEVQKKVVLPRALKVDYADFQQTYSFNDCKFGLENSKIFETIAEHLRHIFNSDQLKFGDLYLDTAKLSRVNQKQIHYLSPVEVLECPVNELIVHSVIGKIQVGGIYPDSDPTVAICLTSKRKQLAVGLNIECCSNMTILDANQLIDLKPNFKAAEIKSILSKLMIQEGEMPLKEVFNTNARWIERAKTAFVKETDFIRFLGYEFRRIEVVNAARVNREIEEMSLSEKTLVVNSRELAKIAIQSSKPDAPYGWNEDQTTSVWNIINFGTGVLKPNRGSNMETILDANCKWTQAVLKAFPLPVYELLPSVTQIADNTQCNDFQNRI
jgi:hypothetical protein